MKTRRAKVVYSYVPQNDDELKLEVDDMIEVLDEIEEGWWKGVTTKGITGVFPSNFVVEVTSDSPQISKKDMSDKSDNDSIDGSKSSLETNLDGLEKKPKPITKIGFGDIFAGGKPKLSPIGDTAKSVPKKPPPPTPAIDNDPAPKLPPKPVKEQARVLFAYEAQNDDELTIKEGDIINIVSKEIEDVGWWKGELNGRIALFPDNFVELIKPSDDQNAKAVKKPERPTEKPPPIVANNSNSPKLTNLSKSESTKSSNKPIEELPKTSVSANNSSVSSSGVTSAPVIPGKKPKVLGSSIFQSKPKQDPPQPSSLPSSIRPDVVPLENGSKPDKEADFSNRTNVNNSSENHFTSMDSTSNKLTHLTANRVKGPSSRRPPSTIFIPKESGLESKENGDVPPMQSTVEVNSNHSTEPKPSQAQTPPEKTATAPPAEKLPPWMVELRKAQEKRKENPEEPPKASLHSPTKTSPNRFSGDFSNKSLQQTSITDEESNSSIHVFKPLKSTKPNITTTSVAPPPVTEAPATVAAAAPTATVASVTATNTSSKTTNIVISSATTTTPSPKVEDSVANVSTDKKSGDSDLEKEIRALKESTVSRKDFDALVKQVTELKEVVESQKQSYSKIIKDLINDVAEERKKLATLQIEIDRLRKLTTTV